MTNSEKILKLESRLEGIADEIKAIKATVNRTDDTKWKKVSEHGRPPINSIVRYWYYDQEKPNKTYIYISWATDLLHPETRYRIIRTPEETERFLKRGAPLPIDSDEHEWHPETSHPEIDKWIVVRLNADVIARVKLNEDNEFMELGWDEWWIKDWRYCTPEEVPSE